ncbi:hypothetical protein BBP00_00008177 [Phytophthora kernoviae]|uniref:Transposase Tc1-like domain-containing protein n=1 Tax=Phytophthora kernoviae TaxID=325452 RepID=A0A3F2RG50_9STRA|nr:hypothetical protein BBP00_00008177 [Phytophthora kernoviae]
MRALAAAVKIPRTTLQRYLARSVIRQVYSRVKPALKAEHKKKRFKFALQHVSRSLGARLYRFDHMYGVMHVDEKWFNLYTALSKFYITTNEKVTYRSCVNKRYIGKIMFLAAVARPRFDFRLKLAGSLEIKSVAMDKNKYKQLLRDIAFPAICSQWPGSKGRIIWVHQDNVIPHGRADDAELTTAGCTDRWQIKMRRQPPKPPGFNVLDLGIFNAIQPRQYQIDTSKLDELIMAVKRSFLAVPSRTIDKCFLMLQKVMECTIKHGGGNGFPLPCVGRSHIKNKEHPMSIICEEDTYKKGEETLKTCDFGAV